MVDKAVPAGLKIWLGFILVFVVLGYPVVPSIVFGLVGAVAGGMISAWWQTLGGIPQPRSPEAEANRSPSRLRMLRRQLRSRASRLRIPKFRTPSLKDRASRSRR